HVASCLGEPSELVDSLAFDAKRDHKAGNLDRRRVATHDRLKSSPRLRLGEGLALHQLGNGVDQLLAPGTLPACGEGSGEGRLEPVAPSTREHRRMKLARIFLPSFVSTDSG